MKVLSKIKTTLILALAAVLFCTAAGLPFGARALAEETDEKPDKYEIALDVSSKRLSVNIKGMLRLTYVNTSEDELVELVMNVYANVLSKDGMELNSVAVCGEVADYTLEKSILTVKLKKALMPNETAELFLRFNFTLPEDGGRFGANAIGQATFVQMLGNALPIAAVYENGAWRRDKYNANGDPFYSKIADYKVAITYPEYYHLAHSGEEIYQGATEGKKHSYILAKSVREFAFALINGCQSAQTLCNDGNVSVTSFAKTKEQADFAADCAAKAIEHFSVNIGDYPYAQLFVVPFEEAGGMEYPGLIMIDKDMTLNSNRDEAALIIGHEVAHQWFYAVVGSDQINSPWLDEALAEYLGCEFLGEYMGNGADKVIQKRYEGFDGLKRIHRIDAPMAEMSAFYAYTVYGCGCRLYADLVDKIGATAFFEGLRLYYEREYMGIGTKESLIDSFSLAAGEELSPWFEQNLAVGGGNS